MPLKKSKGNMYEWVSHVHAHLAGACPHACSYCYVLSMTKRYPAMREKYSGPIRLIEKEFEVEYGSGKTIFIEHLNDLFAHDVPGKFIEAILSHCREWPKNVYVFQSKNPARMLEFMDLFPKNSMLGTTIETNQTIDEKILVVSWAPHPELRMEAMKRIPKPSFVTIEPIMDFDPEILSNWMQQICPSFVNVGADSKGTGLVEPQPSKVRQLLALLQRAGIPVREKHNLKRILDRG